MAAKKRGWPEWWDWPLELTPHLEKRMEDRDFSEVDLRSMLENASGIIENGEEGRWKVITRYKRRGWVIVVEPDREDKLLVVITAYRQG